MLYETKYQTIKNQHENKVSVAQMMMLCWIYGKNRHNRIANENIREIFRVTFVVQKMVEIDLGSLGI